jgi:5-methylcytosine-specific restriction endonuclease McrBC GTP-binding regulatory subunit McrB
MTVIGTEATPVKNQDGSLRRESKIVYEFVSQAFLQAYIEAWRKYANPKEGIIEKQYLVIEEINRGNCAQIFGDLFQLLDRNDKGFSDYPIKADADMAKQLRKQFEGLVIENSENINALYKGKDIVNQVLNGDILLLPNNLYIWATMNTSDQSLFPIDSAFKRRWDWQYRPIADGNKNWRIEVNGLLYDWWDFLEKINTQIGLTTNSLFKKLF